MNKPEYRDISCEEALKRISDYIDHHLGEKSRNELEQHLESCRHCFDRVEFEKHLKARVRNLRPEKSTDNLYKRIDAILEQF